MTPIHDLAWWYWFLTVGLLGAGLFVWPAAISLAILLCSVQIGHVLWLTRDVTAFPVQVRVAYGVMLIAGLWGPLQWIHWLQFAGTTARVLVSYCLLARALSLAPWNRTQSMSFALIRRTFLSLQAVVPSCGDLFRRMSLERVHG
jgi:hypothetical protein